MIILDQTNKTLQVNLATGTVSNFFQFTTSYADIFTSTGNTTTGFITGEQSGTIPGTGQVIVMNSPLSGVQRQAKFISIYNADTQPNTVNMYLYSGASYEQIFEWNINPGQSIVYNQDNDFQLLPVLNPITNITINNTTGGTSFNLWNSGTGLNSIVANNSGNVASGNYSLVSGFDNTGNAPYSSLIGGAGNIISGSSGNIGSSNIIDGGQSNIISGDTTSYIGGGISNTILWTTGNGNSPTGNAILGSYNTSILNSTQTIILGSTLANIYGTNTGGEQTSIISSSNANSSGGSNFSSIIASQNCSLSGNDWSVIIAGYDSSIEGGSTDCAIIGGTGNNVAPSLLNTVIAGGQYISATTSNSLYCENLRVVGGKIYSGGTDLYGIFSTSGVTNSPPGGLINSIQYNNSGIFGGMAVQTDGSSFIMPSGSRIYATGLTAYIDMVNTSIYAGHLLPSINFGSYLMYDSFTNTSEDYSNRNLINTTGGTVLNWNSGVTVTGNLTATTYYSGATSLQSILNNISGGGSPPTVYSLPNFTLFTQQTASAGTTRTLLSSKIGAGTFNVTGNTINITQWSSGGTGNTGLFLLEFYFGTNGNNTDTQIAYVEPSSNGPWINYCTINVVSNSHINIWNSTSNVNFSNGDWTTLTGLNLTTTDYYYTVVGVAPLTDTVNIGFSKAYLVQ